MKRKLLKQTVFTIVVLVLEILPYGVVLMFANPEGEPWRRTFSYFSLTPFGYANFGPFITALLTCVMLVFIIILWFKSSDSVKKILRVISAAAVCTSLMPLIYGAEYITPIGIAVSIFLILLFVTCFIKEKE